MVALGREATYGWEGSDGMLEVRGVEVFLGVVDGHAAVYVACILAFVTCSY
jgi:hypothetical protein